MSRAERLLAHSPASGFPDVRLESRPAVDSPRRLEIVERLLRSYFKAIGDERHSALKRTQDDLWSALLGKELSDLVGTIESRDVPRLSQYLMHFGDQYTWYGGLTLSVDGFNRDQSEHAVSLSYFDTLLRLAEAVGVLPCENPEHGPWGENLHCDIDDVVQKLEDAIGISLTPPDGVIPTTGVVSKKGTFHLKSL